MKKKIIILSILIFLSIFIKIPKYVELNNLAIIEGVGVQKNDNTYTVYLKELIPIKDELGINYDYKYYKEDGKSISTVLKKIKAKSKKKLYFNSVKFLITNMKTSNKIKKVFNIKTKNIYHTDDDIYKQIRSIN